MAACPYSYPLVGTIVFPTCCTIIYANIHCNGWIVVFLVNCVIGNVEACSFGCIVIFPHIPLGFPTGFPNLFPKDYPSVFLWGGNMSL